MTPSVLDTNALMSITHRPPQVFMRGAGMWLWDQDGKPYLDFVQGWAVNGLGHCPPQIHDALMRQSQTLITPSPAYWNAPAAQLAHSLCEHSVFNRVFLASSGAEANEGAIKLARRYGQNFRQGAYEIITFEGGFHGRTLATMSACGKPAFAKLFEPKVPGFPKAVLNDLSSVEQLIGADTVAVMLEPIQGEAGVHEARPDFLRALRDLTRAHGVLLIVDEIQTGVGRTGTLWAYERAGIQPDIMTLGKGLGGGVPLSALLAIEQVACFEPGDQGGTYCGNPLMAAVGEAVLQTVAKPGFLAHVRERSGQLRAGLVSLSNVHGLGEVRGQGLLLALALGQSLGAQVVSQALQDGLLINSPRPDSLRLMPALNVTSGEVDLMLDRLDGVLRRVSRRKRSDAVIHVSDPT